MTGVPWRSEPFRIFFPAGVLLAWIGIGHWVLYTTGITASYSCLMHGLVQMQGFMMAFAVGFLWTAIPRRTRTLPPSRLEMTAAIAALALTTAAGVVERWMIAEAAYAGLLVLLVVFALRRFLASDARRPPAPFVLLPIGLLHGLVGAVLVAVAMTPSGPPRTMALGRLLVEQGVFLCLALGAGGLVLPLIAGGEPPPDLGPGSGERWKALGYGVLGLGIFASLVAEYAGFEHVAPLARAAIVVIGVGPGAGAWRAPRKPGFHRQLVRLAAWMMPVGLAVAGAWPVYRVPALHILFIGGFSLLAFGVATHVALAHLGLERLALGRPPAVVALAVAFLLAMLARVAADASHTYFAHLGWAAGTWIAGSAIWLAFLGPKLFARPPG